MSLPKPSGFTLVEILMVIALVAITSAVAIPRFLNLRNDARQAVTSDRMVSLRNAIVGDSSGNKLGYVSHMGALPATLNDLATKGSKPDYNPLNKTGWNGPYVDATVASWDRDAWGTAYQYSTTTRTLRSCGANLTCGDADDISLSF
jgi:general secretion pathway protein G